MEKQIVVNELVSYGGHNVAANGNINLTLKVNYSELTKSVALLQMLNVNDIKVKAKIAGVKTIALGRFMIKAVNIDDDGCSTIKLNGLADYIEMDNLNKLVSTDRADFKIRFDALVELEEEEDD